MSHNYPMHHSLVFLCLAALLLSFDGMATAQETTTVDEPFGMTVSLTIDYGDGAQKRFPAIVWPSGKKGTVADILAYAEKHARGIKIKARGNGETRFLEAIDGLKNEGAGGKNWMFLVNGELGNSSYATTPVATGADILWKFRTFQ